MRVVNPSFAVDPNLRDESGYSADLGLRGNVRDLLNYDFSLFLISYNDRIGEVLKTDSVLFNTYRYRTNVSDSRNYGLESFVQVDLNNLVGRQKDRNRFSVFTNFSFLDARYINSEVAAYEGNEVELAPQVVFKTGLTFRRQRFKSTIQYAYTSSHFTDATNAEFTANAVNGLIPGLLRHGPLPAIPAWQIHALFWCEQPDGQQLFHKTGQWLSGSPGSFLRSEGMFISRFNSRFRQVKVLPGN